MHFVIFKHSILGRILGGLCIEIPFSEHDLKFQSSNLLMQPLSGAFQKITPRRLGL